MVSRGRCQGCDAPDLQARGTRHDVLSAPSAAIPSAPRGGTVLHQPPSRNVVRRPAVSCLYFCMACISLRERSDKLWSNVPSSLVCVRGLFVWFESDSLNRALHDSLTTHTCLHSGKNSTGPPTCTTRFTFRHRGAPGGPWSQTRPRQNKATTLPSADPSSFKTIT